MGINENIQNVENDLNRLEEEVRARSIAWDMLQDIKTMNKRMFIIIVVILSLWFSSIAGFVWYLNQYDYVSYQQDSEGYNNINTHIQGDVNNNNGAESKSANQENG